MQNTHNQEMLLYENGSLETRSQELLLEEPLSIRIDGNPYSVVMRTPGDEISHAAGFCLAEGLVDEPDDFATIGFCTEEGVNVVTATLQPERRNKIADLLERRGFVSQTSCGICGKELVKDLFQIVKPVPGQTRITIEQAKGCVQRLIEQQNLYQITGSSHASMLFDSNLNILSYAEDVGRHNALDKAIGQVFMEKNIENARLAVLSSRISYELVQKAARARLEIIVSMSRPTALAVELAKSLNMSLACLGKHKGFMIFCGRDRFVFNT